MKNIILILMLCIYSFTGYTQGFMPKCKAVTKKGTQCTRSSIAGANGYCKQHYLKEYRNDPAIDKWLKKHPKKPIVDLPEEWSALSTDATNPDILTGYYDIATNTIYISYKK